MLPGYCRRAGLELSRKRLSSRSSRRDGHTARSPGPIQVFIQINRVVPGEFYSKADEGLIVSAEAQQIEAGPTLYLLFDPLEPVHLSFNRTAAPRQSECRLDSMLISQETGCEVAESGFLSTANPTANPSSSNSTKEGQSAAGRSSGRTR